MILTDFCHQQLRTIHIRRVLTTVGKLSLYTVMVCACLIYISAPSVLITTDLSSPSNWQQDLEMNTHIHVRHDDNSTDDDNSARLQRLRAGCRRHGVDHRLPRNLSVRLVADEMHKAIFCQVLKAGSTSMVDLMGKLVKEQSGGVTINPKDQPTSDARLKAFVPYGMSRLGQQKSTFEEKQRKLDDYFTFLMVRHPLTRLASGYYQRLVHKGRAEPGGLTGQEAANIVSQVRRVPLSSVTADNLTFEDFARYVSQPDWLLRLPGDTHFWTVAYSCYPCAIRYNYVAKLETVQEDLRHILPHLNSSVSHINHENSAHGYQQQYQDAYIDLPTDVFKALLEKYRVDMELFGYTLTGFFSEATLKILASKGVYG